MNIRPREDWQDPAQPVVGPAINLAAVELLPAHYTADNVIPDDIPQYLRNMQSYYTSDRGYSVGYNFAIDQTGEAWELRGFDIKCAANKDMNEVTIAVLCMVDGADAMNDAMCATFTALGADAQYAVGRDLLVVGHRDIGSTSCPGDGIYAQVQAGLLEPGGPPPIPPEVPDMTDEQAAQLAALHNGLIVPATGSVDPNGTPIGVPWIDAYTWTYVQAIGERVERMEAQLAAIAAAVL